MNKTFLGIILVIVVAVGFYYWFFGVQNVSNNSDKKIYVSDEDKIELLKKLSDTSATTSVTQSEQRSVLDSLETSSNKVDVSDSDKLKMLESLSGK